MVKVHLRRALFEEKERVFLESDGVEVSLFRYDTGVEAVRLANSARLRNRAALFGADALGCELRRRAARHGPQVSGAAASEGDRRYLRLPRLS